MNSQKYQECVDSCSEVLTLEPANLKALYRRGQSYLELAKSQTSDELAYPLFKKAKMDLEYVYTHENQQNVKQKLDEAVRKTI